ncbi:MAG: glutamate--tRNA ligase [Patescibacteria group bacterium]|jgi:glutamyl-tRNA synthetase
MNTVRVRFAPSPTGFLHIGGLRTALYNEFFARRHGGTFLLRIEDTDQTRYVPGAVENLLRTLEWSGIKPDEGPYLDAAGQIQERGEHGPYIQSQRLEIYRQYIAELLEKGRAYRCFCTSETLDEMRKNQEVSGRPVMYDRRCRSIKPEDAAARAAAGEKHVIRLLVPAVGHTVVEDAIRGTVSFDNSVVDDQVLIKSDGFPTYHLANVVDDHLMGITHVIRGEEWLPSTPKHVLLYQAFGWIVPVFAHVPLLLNPDRSKLSKRQGDVAVEDYRNKGYLPQAIINFVALLGWNPSGTQEIYAKQELCDKFELGKINKGGAVFNKEKLDWLNREYIKQMSEEDLLAAVLPYYVAAGYAAEALTSGVLSQVFRRAVALERSRVAVLSELVAGTEYLFQSSLVYDKAILPWKKSTAAVAVERLRGIIDLLENIPETSFDDAKAIEQEVIRFIADRGWTNAETLWPMRVALTARAASPSPFEVAWALGKKLTLERLNSALNALK